MNIFCISKVETTFWKVEIMSKKELSAVIFDMDGVIVDTFELYYIANKKVANSFSLPFTREDNNRFRGIGRMEIVETLAEMAGKNLTKEEITTIANEKNKHYQELISKLNEEYILPGMKELILTLKTNNIKTAIASSSTNCKTVLEKVGLIDYFDFIVDPRTVKKGKPDPEIFLKAAAGLNVDPKHCAAIEDGAAGLEAINQTEMFSIAVGDAVKTKPADWHVDHTSDIEFSTLLSKFKGECHET